MKMQTLFGAALILIGAYLFMNRGEPFGAETIISYMWPTMFVIPVGVFFHWLYFSITERKGAGLLIPGGTILTAGIVCQIAMWFDNWDYMWPGFIMAVAVGLFEFYWFGGRNKWLLVPINVLAVLSAIFFAVFSFGSLFGNLLSSPVIAVILVLAGVFMLLFGKKKIV